MTKNMYSLSKVIADRESIEYKPYCKLSVEQYSAIIQSETPLYNIMMLKSLYKMFSKNTDELLSGIDLIDAEFKSRQEIIPYMPDIAQIELNRLLLNCLFSFRTFIDHTEAFIKKYYGKNSKQYKEYHDVIAFIYDNNFEYRFVYKLRNYAQHCGLPLNHFSTKYYKELDFVRIEVLINFDIKSMLKEYDSWGQVKNELAVLKNDLSVAETMIKFRESLGDALIWLNSLYKTISKNTKDIVQDTLKCNFNYEELAITYVNNAGDLFMIDSVFRYIRQIEMI